MSEPKLTKPQAELLHDLQHRTITCSPSYKPSQRLIALGYAELVQGKYSDHVRITDAGRAVLSKDVRPAHQRAE